MLDGERARQLTEQLLAGIRTHRAKVVVIEISRMGSTRRSFTDEYKESAVGFVLDEHRLIAEVARNIDAHEMTLGKWVMKERVARERDSRRIRR